MKKVLSTILVLALAFTFVFAGSSFAFAEGDVMALDPALFDYDHSLANGLDISVAPADLDIAMCIDPSILHQPAEMTVEEIKADLAAATMGVKSENVLYNEKSAIKLNFTVDCDVVLDVLKFTELYH